MIDRHSRPSEWIFTDSDVYWEFTDLEPTSEDNWDVEIVVPDLWLEILATRKKLERSPNNSSALYRLAENIYDATIDKGPDILSTSLYEEGLEAIKRAVRLNPKDVKSHELYTLYLRSDMSVENALLILKEVDTIFELDPGNVSAKYSREDALQSLAFYQTRTAIAISTFTPTSTPGPSAMLKISTPKLTRESAKENPPTNIPTQVDTSKVVEESLTSNPLKLISVLITIILIIIGVKAIIRAITRK